MSGGILFWDVDTQHDFMDPEGALYVPGAETLTPQLSRLTRFAETSQIPVIASADNHSMADAEISHEPDFETTFPPHCMRDTPGAERVDATRLTLTSRVGPEPLEGGEIEAALAVDWPRILILKNQLDVFSNPNTLPILDALGPDRIVVYGVALDFCVRCAIDGLLEHGVAHLSLPMDATKAIQVQDEERLLERWESAGVELATTDDVLGEIPALRALSSSTGSRAGSSGP